MFIFIHVGVERGIEIGEVSSYIFYILSRDIRVNIVSSIVFIVFDMFNLINGKKIIL